MDQIGITDCLKLLEHLNMLEALKTGPEGQLKDVKTNDLSRNGSSKTPTMKTLVT
jgi:hypothetical protein